MENNSHCGFVAIMGRPNVGKSTLLNRILGEKLSITSKKPQTTRHRILGVKTTGQTQIIYVDTPGLHEKESHALNRYMNRAARQALRDVDAVIFVVESSKYTEEDDFVLKKLAKIDCPVILALNKTDLLTHKESLLPEIEHFSKRMNFKDIIPISASKGTGVDLLQEKIAELMPENPHFFPDGQITDKTTRFRIAEIIREKLIRSLGQELPYTSTVEIETVALKDHIYHIHAIIWVEREGQKSIVIGKKGERLKNIGIKARNDLEHLLNHKVHLQLWVKVKGGWSNDERALASLGYLDL